LLTLLLQPTLDKSRPVLLPEVKELLNTTNYFVSKKNCKTLLTTQVQQLSLVTRLS
jgi:hypothetical protein